MEPVYAEVRRLRNRQILIGVLTIVSAAIVLTVAMRSVIVRPIEALAAAARRVGEGDFAVRAPASARDEIGELGAAFNEMTTRLAPGPRGPRAEDPQPPPAPRAPPPGGRHPPGCAPPRPPRPGPPARRPGGPAPAAPPGRAPPP